MAKNVRHFVDVEIVKTAEILITILGHANKSKYETSMNFATKKGEDTESCLGLNFVEFYLLHEVRQMNMVASVGAVRDTYNDVLPLSKHAFCRHPTAGKNR